MTTKRRITVLDMLKIEHVVSISEEEEIAVRPLTLAEMLDLFYHFRTDFVKLYGSFMAGGHDLDIGPVLMASPALAARIIAQSTGAKTEEEIAAAANAVFNAMPGTVQLIAIKKIWDISVPDPKKLGELLSVVTEQLQKLQVVANAKATLLKQQKQSGQTISSEPSNTSLPTDTGLMMSSDTPSEQLTTS